MCSKSSSLSVSSFKDKFFNDGIQPYSREPTFSKAPVVYEGEHGSKKKLMTRKKLMKELPIKIVGYCVSCRQALKARAARRSKESRMK